MTEQNQKKRKRGRPRKRKPPKRSTHGGTMSLKKRRFDETKVGFLLKHEVPIEYEMITNAVSSVTAPSPDLIEAIAYSSDDPFFKKNKFWLALRQYRLTGLYPVRAVKSSVSKELYYARLRRNKAD